MVRRKNQNRRRVGGGVLKAVHGGGALTHFLKMDGYTKGTNYSKNESVDLSRDFCLCEPLDPEGGNFAPPPAFWQLSMRGNYRDVAAHDMANVYTRNIAKQRLCASDFAQSALRKTTSLESIQDGPPVYPGNRRESEMSSFAVEFQWLKPADLAMAVLALKGKGESLGKRKMMLRMPSRRGEFVVADEQNDPIEYTRSSTAGEGSCNETLLLRSVDIERLNYRFPRNKFRRRRGPVTPFQLRMSGRRAQRLSLQPSGL